MKIDKYSLVVITASEENLFKYIRESLPSEFLVNCKDLVGFEDGACKALAKKLNVSN